MKVALVGQQVYLSALLILFQTYLPDPFFFLFFFKPLYFCNFNYHVFLLAIPGYWDFLDKRICIHVPSVIYWRAHLPVGVLNVVIHDRRGATSPFNLYWEFGTAS